MSQASPKIRYTLVPYPTHLTSCSSIIRGKPETPIFEPYEENLPLESGYYSFVIDQSGNLRIKRGNTSSHAAMTAGRKVAAAGHFWINRAGKVGRIVCTSRDYRIAYRNRFSDIVSYIIRYFSNHTALELSQHAIFRFHKSHLESFTVDENQEIITNESLRQSLVESEGEGNIIVRKYSEDQIHLFKSYNPKKPPRLYNIKLDQFSIESDSEDEQFELGTPQPKLSPESSPLTSGRKAFILDRDGWLIVGSGHHLLSGGHPVGAAGQFQIGELGEITDLSLNFSGHYRPKATSEYLYYTYQTLHQHPLVLFAQGHSISARIHDGADLGLDLYKFQSRDLLDELLDPNEWNWDQQKTKEKRPKLDDVPF